MQKTDVLLIDCDSQRVPSLEEGLRRIGYSVTCEKLLNLQLGLLDQFPLLVISGGPHLFTNPADALRLRESFEFLRHYKNAVFGICLGHQALGLVSDAEVYRGEERRDSERIEWVMDSHPCFAGLPSGSSFVTDHCEGITKPSDYQILSRSEAYPVEMMLHLSKPRVGVQFHPESSGENGWNLIHASLKYLLER